MRTDHCNFPLFPAIAGFLLSVLFASPAYALWGTFPNDEPIKADNWPTPVVDSLNHHKRLWGGGSWDFGWDFYLSGDTADLNKMLKEIARDKASELHVVLNTELGIVHPGPFDEGPEIKCDWAVHLYPIRDAFAPFVIERKGGETDEDYLRRTEEARKALPEFGVRIEIYHSPRIDVEKLELPVNYRAAVGGHLADLVNFHNLRHDGAAEARATPSTTKPTTQASFPRWPVGNIDRSTTTDMMRHSGGGIFSDGGAASSTPATKAGDR